MNTSAQDMPFLDFTSPGFSTHSNDVLQARANNWCARTPYGLAVLRHREVGLLLRDKRLRQGSYSWPETNGLTGSFAEFWKRSVIGQEGDLHKELRRVAVSALAPDFVAGLKPQFDTIADRLAQSVAERGRCEFMQDFATPFSGQAICILLGLQPDEWEAVSHDAAHLGFAMGVDCKKHQALINTAYDRLAVLADRLIQSVRMEEHSTTYIARLVENFDTCGLDDRQYLQDLVVISIFGGVDTTKSQLGFAVSLFAEHPEQWKLLRKDTDLVGNAVEESIRSRPTTTWATREAIESFEFEGQQIEKGETLHMLVHASARDPKICENPEFDIRAKRKLHFGFGGGSHHCIGHLVARTDMASALLALTRYCTEFSYDGEPKWLPDTGNTSPVSLPLRLQN